MEPLVKTPCMASLRKKIIRHNPLDPGSCIESPPPNARSEYPMTPQDQQSCERLSKYDHKHERIIRFAQQQLSKVDCIPVILHRWYAAASHSSANYSKHSQNL